MIFSASCDDSNSSCAHVIKSVVVSKFFSAFSRISGCISKLRFAWRIRTTNFFSSVWLVAALELLTSCNIICEFKKECPRILSNSAKTSVPVLIDFTDFFSEGHSIIFLMVDALTDWSIAEMTWRNCSRKAGQVLGSPLNLVPNPLGRMD